MKKIALFLLLTSSLVFGATTANAQSTFWDVSDTKHSWAIEAIDFMSDSGVITGYADGTYRPDAPVTKAEFVSMFSRLFDKYGDATPNYNFKDVPSNNWAYDAVAKVLTSSSYFTYKMVDDVSYFSPNTELTRIGLVNLMPLVYNEMEDANEIHETLISMKDVRVYADAEGYAKDGRFDATVDRTNKLYPIIFSSYLMGNNLLFDFDDDYSAIVGKKLASIQNAGLMTAYNGQFNPTKKLTRAEAATILYRLYTDLKEKGKLAQYSTKY
ncbi:Endo-1,4-beta-xylanase A precursor [Paenibacillus sp. P1XP2]|nr:Endo-1,4-beta-xylanase A precursor [Paenibacillus sp. P1XP2]